MYTATLIRKYILNLPEHQIFTTREVLNYGSRSAVDRTLFRLVRSYFIVRLARGVFIRNGSKRPPLAEIAKVKAAAFCKQIVRHAADFAKELGLTEKVSVDHTFAVNGSSSSFRVDETIVYFKGVCPRKLRLADSKVGQVISALWYLGESRCNSFQIMLATKGFGRQEREELSRSLDRMPLWMPPLFASIGALLSDSWAA